MIVFSKNNKMPCLYSFGRVRKMSAVVSPKLINYVAFYYTTNKHLIRKVVSEIVPFSLLSWYC